MRELRRPSARSFEDKHVLIGVREMVLTANDMADAQVDVIGARCQMVSRHSVGPKQSEVFDVVRRFALLSVNRVIEAHRLAGSSWNTEAKRERLSSCGPAIAFRAGKLTHPRIEE